MEKDRHFVFASDHFERRIDRRHVTGASVFASRSEWSHSVCVFFDTTCHNCAYLRKSQPSQNILCMQGTEQLKIEVISDSICPWCYVGKRRLERALALLGNPLIEVEWKPFQLNPTMPREGMNRRDYRTRKFGSWEYSRALDAQVRAAGAEVGIPFAHNEIERTPNTLASHQLIWLAGRNGRQDAVVEAIFRAYFVRGATSANPLFYWNWDCPQV
jgi:hypothetical protein